MLNNCKGLACYLQYITTSVEIQDWHYPTSAGPHDCHEKCWYLCVVINAISFFTGTVKEGQ